VVTGYYALRGFCYTPTPGVYAFLVSCDERRAYEWAKGGRAGTNEAGVLSVNREVQWSDNLHVLAVHHIVTIYR